MPKLDDLRRPYDDIPTDRLSVYIDRWVSAIVWYIYDNQDAKWCYAVRALCESVSEVHRIVEDRRAASLLSRQAGT